jgi:hypothetical protein
VGRRIGPDGTTTFDVADRGALIADCCGVTDDADSVLDQRVPGLLSQDRYVFRESLFVRRRARPTALDATA